MAIAGAALIAGLMGLNGLIPYWDARFAEYDHNSYLAMARDGIGAPGRASAPPFCWRILTPLLARSLPAPLPIAFFLLSFAGVACGALAMYRLFLKAGLSHSWSLIGEVSFFSYFWAAGFNLWNYIMVDALSLLIVAVGLILLEEEGWSISRRQLALAVIMCLGALNKESFLVLGVAALVYWWRNSPGSALRRFLRGALPLAPAVALAVAVRLSIEADVTQMREFSSYSLPSVFLQMLLDRLGNLPKWIAEAFVDPWGPLVLVPLLLNPSGAIHWFRRYPHRFALVAAAFAQTFFGTSAGRLVIVAVPVVGLYAMLRLRSRIASRQAWVAALSLLLLSQFTFQYLRRTTLGLGIPPYDPHPLVALAYGIRAAAFLAFLLLWLWLGRRQAGARAQVVTPSAGR